MRSRFRELRYRAASAAQSFTHMPRRAKGGSSRCADGLGLNFADSTTTRPHRRAHEYLGAMQLEAAEENSGRAVQAVLADPVCRAVLERMPQLGLLDWWLTAGAVFQNIWNAEEGKPAGYGIKDYDVFYFDSRDLTWHAEDQVIQAAAALFCCVGMTSLPDGDIRAYAPHGLRDVFDRVMRPNARLSPKAVYETKVRQYQERWPSITSEPWPDAD